METTATRLTAPASSANSRTISALSSTAPREPGLDALRAAATLLVLFHHTAITYGAIGGWFYREVPTNGTLGTKLLTFFCTVNQAYFMGLFFLLAGYFTPSALARHGVWSYVQTRILRLGAPLVVFGFVIGPFTIALAQTAQGRPFAATLVRLWERGTFEIGPLWFAEALLIFSLAFLVWRGFTSRLIADSHSEKPYAFPANWVIGSAALLTGAAAFALRLTWPVGTQVSDLQLGYFASYVVLFAAGCIGASGHWLSDVPESQRRMWLRLAWRTLPVLPVVVLLAPHVSVLRGDPSGGWNVQAAVYAFWEPLVAWGFMMALLQAFGRRFSKPSPAWRALARRAYAIYVIHPPVLVGIALAWRDVPAPSLLKFALTGIATCLACFWIAGLLLRVPVISKIL